MERGLIAHWDRYEALLESSFSVSRTGAAVASFHGGGAASLTSRYSYDPILEVVGIGLGLNVSSGGPTGTGSFAELSIPALGIDFTGASAHTISGSVVASASTHVEVDGLKIFTVTQVLWEVHFTELRWYVDGVLIHTEAGTTIRNLLAFTPAAIPMFGIPPELAASAFVNPVPILGSSPSGTSTANDYSVISTVSATGGWRFKEAGAASYTTLTVTPATLGTAAEACDCSATRGTATATNTYDGAVTAYSSLVRTTTGPTVVECDECTNGPAVVPWTYNVYDNELVWEVRAGQIMLIPNLAKRITRMNPDYQAVVFRGGMPMVDKSAWQYCGYIDPTSDTVVAEVLPEQSSILFGPGSAAHAAEDTLGYDTFAPVEVSGSIYEALGRTGVLVSPGACPASLPEEPPGTIIDCIAAGNTVCMHQDGARFPNSVQTRGGALGNADMIEAWDHAEYRSRYVNFWANPHWSYLLYFPPRTLDLDGDGELDAQDDWPVLTEAIDPNYWIQLRTQWAGDPNLSEADQTGRRLHNPIAPLYEGPYSTWISSAIMGVDTSWWGSCRFHADTPVPLEELELDADSEDLWSFVNCSASFGGSGITLTPDVDQLVIDAILDIGRFDHDPYQWLHLVDRLLVGWTLTYATMSVRLVSQSGYEVELATVAGTYSKPVNGADLTYAGSHAHDFGNLMIVDQGYDTLAQGDSVDTVDDPERVAAFSHLAGQDWAALKFQVTITADPDADPPETPSVLIDYPTFYFPEGDATIFQESAHHAALVFADGPGVRFGTHAWFYDGTFHDQPIPTDPGWGNGLGTQWKATITDYLAWRREYIEGKNEDDGFLAEISAMFDDYEGAGVLGFPL